MHALPTVIRSKGRPLSPEDFYMDRGLFVFTAAYHVKRGHCCGCKCRHCPYEPQYRPGSTCLKGNLPFLEVLESPHPSK
jgi:hypothetical protein